jgi:hypothetical protein
MADLLQWQLSNGVVIELDRDSKAVRVFSRNVRLHFEYGDPKEIIKILRGIADVLSGKPRSMY